MCLKLFNKKILFYNIFKSYDTFFENIDQYFFSCNKILFFGYLKILGPLGPHVPSSPFTSAKEPTSPTSNISDGLSLPC
jgi:hypothetical protein